MKPLTVLMSAAIPLLMTGCDDDNGWVTVKNRTDKPITAIYTTTYRYNERDTDDDGKVDDWDEREEPQRTRIKAGEDKTIVVTAYAWTSHVRVKYGGIFRDYTADLDFFFDTGTIKVLLKDFLPLANG